VDEPQNATEVDIAALIVDLKTRLSFVQAELDRLGKLLLVSSRRPERRFRPDE